MKLLELLDNITCEVKGCENVEITGLQYDSRAVNEGDLFFCIEGFNSDGHKYAHGAVEKGAKCLVVSHYLDEPVTQVKVEDTRKAMSLIAANYYGNASRKMLMIGVTGTSGKTSTTYFLKSVFEKAGKKVGIIGTVHISYGDVDIASERTTPESLDLQKIFSDMYNAGVEVVIMEVSSHSLYLNRVYGVKFDGSIYTNLSQDHLDFHKTFDEYFKAKSILFYNTKAASINSDDKYGKQLVDISTAENQTFGLEEGAQVTAKNVKHETDGSTFDLVMNGETTPVALKLPGIFMVYNALGVISLCSQLGISKENIKSGVEALAFVPGRVENINTYSNKFSIVLDYCHKPEPLESVLKMIKAYAKGRVVCIFGCGGNRDSAKRPIMGHIAESIADFCIVTSDNPRFEDPNMIIDDIIKGMEKDNRIVIENRRDAIKYAISNAQENDVILLAGKGHEDYQEIKGVHYPFDEKVIVDEILHELNLAK